MEHIVFEIPEHHYDNFVFPYWSRDSQAVFPEGSFTLTGRDSVKEEW